MSIRRFFHRKQWDAERAAELESHLQIETDRNVEAGMSPPTLGPLRTASWEILPRSARPSTK